MLALLALIALQQDLQPIATVKAPALNEMSGLIASGRDPGVYWTHNDSGGAPAVYAIRADGSFAGDATVKGAKNVDWECITRLGSDLVVADVGNNGNTRRDLGLYIFPEPALDAKEVSNARFVPVAYPDQREFPPANRHFDCEAIFTHSGKLYLITKHRANEFLADVSANLYRLDKMEPSKPNVLVRVDSARDLGGWVTDACMSPDGRNLAVLTQFPVASVWIFQTPLSGDRFFQSKSRQIVIRNVRQAEGLCWESNRSILINNEQRDLFRVAI